mgnify:CR=1 FL=1
MSNDIVDPGEGHSPAAWTAVVIMLIGVTLATVGFVIGNMILVWIAVATIVVGALSGWVLAKAGYGVNGPKFTPKPHHY